MTKYLMVFKDTNRTFIDNNRKQFSIRSMKWKKEGKKE